MTELLQHAEVVAPGEMTNDRAIAKLVAMDLLYAKAPAGRREDDGGVPVLEEDEWPGLAGGEHHPGHDQVALRYAIEFLERDVREGEPQPRPGDGESNRTSLTCRGRLAVSF